MSTKKRSLGQVAYEAYTNTENYPHLWAHHYFKQSWIKCARAVIRAYERRKAMKEPVYQHQLRDPFEAITRHAYRQRKTKINKGNSL